MERLDQCIIQDTMSKGYECCSDYREYIKLIKLARANSVLTDAVFNSVLILNVESGCGCKSILKNIYSALYGTIDESQILFCRLQPGLRLEDPSARSILDISRITSKDHCIVCADVSGCTESDQVFIELLNKFSEKIGSKKNLFVLRINHSNKNIPAYIGSKMQSYIIDVPVSDSYVFTAEVIDTLNRCEKNVEYNAYDEINNVVMKNMQEPCFHGYKSVSKIALDILNFISYKTANYYNITGDVIRSYIEYISRSEEKKDALSEIRSMVGMEKVADQVEEIITLCKENKNNGLQIPKLHMALEGPAGCGKSTVARLISKAYTQAGILRSSSFTELHGRDFAAPYMGQTAQKTNSILSSLHGVVFIDEFYAICLDNEGKDEYGYEAVDTLIKIMEDRPSDELVIIVAGYTEDMESVLSTNQGLRSRVPWVIRMNPYSKNQLKDIFLNMVPDYYVCEGSFYKTAEEYFMKIPEAVSGAKEFGQGRFCRNLLEKVCIKSASRRAANEDYRLIINADDFNEAVKVITNTEDKLPLGFAS